MGVSVVCNDFPSDGVRAARGGGRAPAAPGAQGLGPVQPAGGAAATAGTRLLLA